MKGMTLIVKNITIWVKILIFMFGIYVTLFGHLTPGGGFAGGVILASSYVLLVMAYGREFAEENLSLKAVSKLDCVGALMFAAVALFGLCYGATSFFYNFIHMHFIHLTLIAYSPSFSTCIFSAIVDFSVPRKPILPCQLVEKSFPLHLGQLSPSTKSLHFLQAFFLLIF